ncbi:MAG: HAD family hydrolase [Anaerolineae bacterium]|nr:HAD family hydrolase [Anaerolineae bacterium]
MTRGIIFDLGSTLIHFTRDWESVNQEGVEAMTAWYLKKKHVRLDEAAFVEAFLAERMADYERGHQTQTQIVAQQSLRKALQKIGAPPQAEALVEGAIKVYFGPEEAAWQPYPDAVATLKLFKDQGYRLGLYSNASDDPLIQRLVNQNGLRPWLSPTFSSAGWDWRKPKPEAFDLIARRWGLPAEEIVVVGDTLEADILGAQNAGMQSILVTMDENPANIHHRHIQPTAVAESLSELPEMVPFLS